MYKASLRIVIKRITSKTPSGPSCEYLYARGIDLRGNIQGLPKIETYKVKIEPGDNKSDIYKLSKKLFHVSEKQIKHFNFTRSINFFFI